MAGVVPGPAEGACAADRRPYTPPMIRTPVIHVPFGRDILTLEPDPDLG
jgi:hypothetical protein